MRNIGFRVVVFFGRFRGGETLGGCRGRGRGDWKYFIFFRLGGG